MALSCGHGLCLDLADDSGMTCDGPGCGGGEIDPGEPLLGCRECNVDWCVRCVTADKVWEAHRDAARWTQAHRDAAKGSAYATAETCGRDAVGWAPTHWAAWSAKLPAKDFVENGLAGLEQADNSGQTPFMVLARHGAPGYVRAVLDAAGQPLKTALVSALDEGRRSALWHACLRGPVDAVKAMLGAVGGDNADADVVNGQDDGGLSPLHVAALRGEVEIVRALLEHGADANASSSDELTPLALAVQSEAAPRCVELVVAALLDGGARADRGASPESNGMSPLLVVAAERRLELVKLLASSATADLLGRDDQGRSALMLAVMSPEPESASATEDPAAPAEAVAEALLGACPADALEGLLELRDEDEGLTALHIACEEGEAQAALAILSRCPARLVDCVTKTGVRPLHLASKAGQVELVEALLGRGASASAPTAADSGGYTPLHFAAHYAGADAAKTVSVLLEAGAAAATATEGEGLTPLHLAALFCDVPTCVALIEEGGADVNAVDRDLDTPLHNAAGKQEGDQDDRLPVVEMLLDRGAELERANRKSFTPLAAAAAAENRSIAALLIGRGAKAVVKPDEAALPAQAAEASAKRPKRGAQGLRKSKKAKQASSDPSSSSPSETMPKPRPSDS